ncbi:MAG: coenzyme F390 synthetase [Thermodesulfobacteriota bacterium]|nr:MAG: coenzyme F390 synthetase [Thermodesulfobacteriota bacterium]
MEFKEIMAGVWSDVQELMPEHVERLSWTKDQVREHQTKKFRELLKTAKEKTKYYSELLADVDIDNFTLEDLHILPPNDKTFHMDRWDDFVAAPGITYEVVENHLEKLRKGEIDDPFYNDEYLFVSTGGSTGKRGVFLWDMEFICQIICYTYRYILHDEIKNSYEGPFKLATVEAPTLLHGSPYVFPSKFVADMDLLSLASTDPIPEVCEKLNEYQPTHLMAYASSVGELAAAQLKGMLDIHPRWVCTNSGPQDEDIRNRTIKAWGVKASNSWGCCEIGQMAIETEFSPGMVICADGAIFEVVDKNNQPVDNVEDAAKVLATNLTNFSMPMIRYEVDDIVEIGAPLPEYPAYGTVKRILGKATFWFQYGDIKVHPTSYSDILEVEKEVEEFQIVQTEEGAHIKLVCNGEPNIAEMKDTILKNLNKYGLHDPIINFEVVDSLPRHPETGKIKRFIPL